MPLKLPLVIAFNRNPMPSPHIPILCYHRICPVSERGADSPSLCVTPEQFQAQMRWLKRFNYKTLSPQTLVACRQGLKKIPPRSVVLTFDDGYADNFHYAFPILKKFDFTATIFLVTNRIGEKNTWDKSATPLLNEKQIEEMLLAGIDFGSHSATHIDMSVEKSEMVRQELESSMQVLQKLTSRLDISFCYPYARTSPETIRLVQETKYLCAFAGDRNYAPPDDNIFNCMRIQIFPSTSLFAFWKKLQPWFPRWAAFQKKL